VRKRLAEYDRLGTSIAQVSFDQFKRREVFMFRNREDAALQLAKQLKGRSLHDPLVLAIPRGGVVTGAVLARELGADLDVILARKLRAPQQPELAIGAVSESGEVFLNNFADEVPGVFDEYINLEKQRQMKEIVRRNRLLRESRPPAPIEGRTVIVADDGIATGSTMIAALKEVRAHRPREVIVAVPVAAADSLAVVKTWSDSVVCLLTPEDFMAVGLYYEEFNPVEDERVVAILQDFKPTETEHFDAPSPQGEELGIGD
jgi:putative phosphoribosyl transferase